jgi:hypothetical protein
VPVKLGAIAIVLGLALFAYALTVPPYKDEKRFMERYMALSADQNKEYWALRDEMLTNRFRYQDYGVTLVAAGLISLFAFRRGVARIEAPRSRGRMIGLALALPFLTVAGYVIDLMLAFGRGEFPHWADSMGMPLAGVPFLLVLLLAWASAHLLFLGGAYKDGAALKEALSRHANWYLLAISALTGLAVGFAAFSAQYYYALPGVAWLYFYLSLSAGRRSAYGT